MHNYLKDFLKINQDYFCTSVTEVYLLNYSQSFYFYWSLFEPSWVKKTFVNFNFCKKPTIEHLKQFPLIESKNFNFRFLLSTIFIKRLNFELFYKKPNA